MITAKNLIRIGDNVLMGAYVQVIDHNHGMKAGQTILTQAAEIGEAVIEKHFTLDHALKLPDHEAALDPIQFSRLVERVKLVPNALGDGVKRILPTEQKWRQAARKPLFAAIDIPAGTVIAERHIAIRRPSEGIHPHYLALVLGRAAKAAIPAGTLLQWEMF